MKYTSIFEKIGCLFNQITSSIIYPIFIAVIIFLIILLFVKKIKNKKIVLLMIMSYLILFITIIANNYESLSKVFDSLSTNIFTNIYFPSTYTYLFILIIIDISTISSLINIKTEKIYKIINGICFFVIQFVFSIVLNIIAKGNIDIFSKKSLFTNTDLIMLLELSVNIFIVWILILMGVYITNKITERILVKRTNKELKTSPSIETINNIVLEDAKEEKCKKEYLNEQEVLENVQPKVSPIESQTNTFYTTDTQKLKSTNLMVNPSVQELNRIKDLESNILLDKLLNNGLPLIKEEQQVKEIKPEEPTNNYTLNDYKVFNKILKDIKVNNNGNVVNIDKNLERRIITKYPIEEYNLFKVMLKNYSN